MAGTHVFYNGVEMRDCNTTKFEQESYYDESKGLITNKWVIGVESLVFGFFNAAPSTPTDYDDLHDHPSTTINAIVDINSLKTATDRMQLIQNRLNEPRKDFWYATHGGQFEDRYLEDDPGDEPIYQMLLCATGPDKLESQPYFKDAFGNDIVMRYNIDFSEVADDGEKVQRDLVVDSGGGPFPRNVRITNVYDGRVFKVTFEIEIHRHLDPTQEPQSIVPFGLSASDNARPSPFILSNSWTSEETIDELHRRIKTVSGTLRVRDQRYWSHAFRTLCMPALLPGYRRKSMKFASDPTNLILKYSIVDIQAEAAPPYPAIDWKMHHSDRSLTEGLATTSRILMLELTGRPHCNKARLLAVGFLILNSRFNGFISIANPAAVQPVKFMQTGLVTDSNSSEPVVQIRAYIRQMRGGTDGYISAVYESMTTPLPFAGYNPDRWPEPRPFDTDTPAGIFACYLQRPVSQWHGIPSAQTLNLAAVGMSNVAALAPNVQPEYWKQVDYQHFIAPEPLPQSTDVTRPEHQTFPYTHLDIDTRYVLVHGKTPLPLSVPRNVATESDAPIMKTVAMVQLHAPVMKRVSVVVGTRHGMPPEMPYPAETLVDPNGVIETLVDSSELVIDYPTLSSDQSHRVFRAQQRLVYQLDRPLTPSEKFRAAASPAHGIQPGQNWIPGGAIFSKGRIDYHEEPGYAPESSAPTYWPGYGYDPTTGRRAGYPNYESPGNNPASPSP